MCVWSWDFWHSKMCFAELITILDYNEAQQVNRVEKDLAETQWNFPRLTLRQLFAAWQVLCNLLC